MENFIKPFTTKIADLVIFLKKTREGFEFASDEMDEDHLRLTLRGLAIETKQYEQEIKSQLQMLKIEDTLTTVEFGNDETLKNIRSIKHAASLKEILNICSNTEICFEKMYSNVLNEYFPYKTLRDMLVYQLNGIKYAFLKLKLLNSIQ